MKYYIIFNNETGNIEQLMETKSDNSPTLTVEEAKEKTLIELDKNDIPKGQIIGKYKINIEQFNNNKLLFELRDNIVMPVNMTKKFKK